jgi:2-polyprenyl-6-methoxyphenol hydroxylase-like FAD-dependent oxidoreductase
MVDVLVVGGGPVGMVTALGLARVGVTVRLIEAQPCLRESPRAAVYHWSVLDGLARIGLIDDIERIALKTERYTYIVKCSGERISFSMRAAQSHGAALQPPSWAASSHRGRVEKAHGASKRYRKSGSDTREFGTRFGRCHGGSAGLQ